MAEKLNPGSNIAQIKADIQAAGRELDRIEEEKRKLGEQAAAIKRDKIKAHGITIKEFEKARHFYKLQDADEQVDAFDNFKLCMDAFGMHAQLSLFSPGDDADDNVTLITAAK